MCTSMLKRYSVQPYTGLVRNWCHFLGLSQVNNSMPQPVQTTPSPVIPEPHPLTTVTPTPPSDPVVRQQVVQDLMAQMQGPYNFMQVGSFAGWFFCHMFVCILNGLLSPRTPCLILTDSLLTRLLYWPNL